MFQIIARATWRGMFALAVFVNLSAASHAQRKINLLYAASGDFVTAYVAADQKFFEKRGLDVELTLTALIATVPASLLADSAQIAGVTPSTLLQANDQGLDLIVVAGTSVTPAGAAISGFVVRTDSGITRASDLIGKKIAVPGFGAALDLLARKWVQTQGVDYRRVDWVEMPLPQLGDAMQARIVDGAVAVNPFYRRILDTKIGYAFGDISAPIPSGTASTVFVATRTWARRNGEAVQSFRQALREAAGYIAFAENQDAVRQSIVKYTKLPPQAAATITLPAHIQPDANAQGLAFWIEVEHEQGLIKGNPDPASLIAP